MGLYTDLISDEKKKPVDSQQVKTASPSSRKRQVPVKKNQKRTYARKQPNVQANKQARLHVTMRAYLNSVLSGKATNGFTFRYPPEVLEQLEDILYEVKKKHKKKLPKNTVAVMALAYILKDYLEKGDESVFYKVFISDEGIGN